jgi:hypothetical protein
MVLFATVLFSACGDDETTAEDRKGTEGESCTKTSDCQSPLSCVMNVCTSGGTGGQGMGGDGTGGIGIGGSGGGPMGGMGGMVVDNNCDTSMGVGPCESLGACDDCLDALCVTGLAACGPACVAIEACIEMICKTLTVAGEEGLCQVYCQNLNPTGTQQHLDVVNCAFANGNFNSCQTSNDCGNYPVDYTACRATMIAGQCADEHAACEADANCVAYRDCLAICTLQSDCVACSATPAGAAGRLLLEADELCLAAECIAESWTP